MLGNNMLLATEKLGMTGRDSTKSQDLVIETELKQLAFSSEADVVPAKAPEPIILTHLKFDDRRSTRRRMHENYRVEGDY